MRDAGVYHGLQRALATFLAGGGFWPLWRATMDATELPDEGQTTTTAEEAWFASIYDLVYMSQDVSVSVEDRRVGLMGEAELRDRLVPFALGPETVSVR